MSESILNSTKKVLGLDEEYTAFDTDIIMHINTVFMTLQQLSVGPPQGFMIQSASETWDDYLSGNLNLNSVKSYVYLRVRLLFDPPTLSFMIEAYKEQIKELEWRINEQMEGEKYPWVPPVENSTLS